MPIVLIDRASYGLGLGQISASSIFNLQSLIPEKGVSRIGYAFGHNCKSIV